MLVTMFGKSKTSNMPSPVEKIKTMSKMGIGEKEIVKQLKSEGYSFSEIEQGMMAAMKEGIESQPQQVQFAQATPPKIEQGREDLGMSWPKLERPEELFPEAQQQSDISPEVAMEDLIENITYEKFEKYDQHLKELEDTLSGFDHEIQQLSEEIKKKPVVEIPKELEDRIENMEAKINGLEKAFRQILPTITKSVEELKSTLEHIKKTPVSAQSTNAVPGQSEYQKYYPNVPLFATKTISKSEKPEDAKEEKPVQSDA